jgi:intracellular sulfur oxidation DsrE/DsrF family protein
MKSISRRSFVTTAAAGMAALGPLAGALPAAQGQAVEMASDWDLSAFQQLAHHPARVKQLFDVVPLKKQVFEHIQNSLNGLQFGFGIPAHQIQIVAVSRGFATFFNFDDHIWKTYGIGALTSVNDPKTGQPAERNIFYPSSAGPDLKYASDDPENRNSLYNDSSIQALQHRGVRFLCCHNATYGLAHYIAGKRSTEKTGDQIYKDMIAHTLPGVMIVAAAVAAVALLQSEGHYSYLYV